MTMTKILIVDDDVSTCRLLRRLLEKAGFAVRAENSPVAALALAAADQFDLLITDYFMPEMNGTELFTALREVSPATDVIMMTAFASIDNAVDAIRKGAYDYIVKPFQNDDLLMAVHRVREKRRLEQENRALREVLATRNRVGRMVGASPAMEKVFSAVQKVADSDATVLITGESGTGKELVARAIHNAGQRKSHPFVAVNCSALPDTLLESELFGHVKGAFTGAAESRQGLLAAANQGTLFLDEIADTSSAIQAKLLRVLEDKVVRRLGETRETAVDVRIIAATGKDLKDLIARQFFREDLFYRINVVPLALPPLRERREDIPLLVKHFLGMRKEVHPAALDALVHYDWPGNVRELANIVERLILFSAGPVIMIEDLPAEMRTLSCSLSAADLPYQEARARVLDEFNRAVVRSALMQNDGNVSRAAERLGLDRANFQRLMRRCGIISADFKYDARQE